MGSARHTWVARPEWARLHQNRSKTMRIGRLFTLLALVGWALPTFALGETLPPVSERFATDDIAEEPSFQRHVSPLFGRLGCNGRSCHGSFQGRGDFRLSLFGYDFKADHDELLKGDPLRANKDKPLESLILVKPTDADMHEGGKRYEKDGWEYHVFRRWLEAGAKYSQQDDQRIVNLEVTPAEILFARPGETVNLKAVAIWPDGTREDVTCLCRFNSNSEQVATITENGLVTATEPGDTHVIVAYDSAVISVPVIRPVSQLTGDRYPDVPTPTKIDELVVQKLRKLGEVPSDLSTDAEFLRRVSLDLTGTLPTAADVEKFLADKSPNKRAEEIDELLKTPAYAAWWTTRLNDWTGNNDTKFNGLGTFRQIGAQLWYDWIYDRVADNVSYDKIAEGIVTAVSREPGESYYDYSVKMSKIFNKEDTYAERPSLPHFWGRTGFRTSEERAIGFAYTFLGIRIQCAQCHKHPFDQWSKSDFDAFKNFFARVSIVPYGAADKEGQEEYNRILKEVGLDKTELRGNQLRNELERGLRAGKIAPFPDIAANRNGGRGGASKARVLGGEEIDLAKVDDPRSPVMDWLRAKDNPYFARAFVNRVWSNYFNVGIVQPPDDLSLGNPPSNKPLLDYLTEGFIASGYDMKWVHRTITNSRTYQLSWQPNETNAKDERNFARAVPRRLPAEVAVDAVAMATASDERAAKFSTELTGRAISVPGASARANQGANARDTGFALQVFGRSIRESNCDCDRSMEASLLQTVFLQNDNAVLQAIEKEGSSWLSDICGSSSAKEVDAGKSEARNLAQMKDRLEQLQKKNGNDQQAKRLADRIEDLEKTLAAKKDAADDLTMEAPAVVRNAYLRTLSREPSQEEMDRCLAYLAEAESPAAGAKGLLWTLLNTKEFIVNH